MMSSPGQSATRGFEMRHAEPEDAAAILAYLKQMAGESNFVSFGPEGLPMTEEAEAAHIERVRKSDNGIFVLAVAEGSIIGAITFMGGDRPRTRHLGEFGVSVLRAWWGRGVGRTLLDELIGWARRSGVVRKINLRVRVDNDRAIALYEDLGFRHEGRITRDLCIDGVFFDSFHMGLELDPDDQS